MDFQSEKLALMKQLLETESWEVVCKIKNVFKDEATNFYNELPARVRESIHKNPKSAEEDDTRDSTLLAEFKARYGITS